MGNCECIPADNSAKPIEQEPTNRTLKIARPEQQSFEKTSLVSFSDLSRSNRDKLACSNSFFDMSKEKLTYSMSQASYSPDRLLTASMCSNKQNIWQIKIEVGCKLSIKQFYDLRKLISKNQQITRELQLSQSFFEKERTRQSSINQKQFRKILITNEEGKDGQVAYYEGKIIQAGQIHFLEGKGELLFENGAYYNGNFLANHFEGIGLYIHPDKDYYYGSWKNNKASGHGEFHHFQGVMCQGEWAQDVQHGNGEEYWPDGAVFQGLFEKGMKKIGRFSWPNKSYYQGQFRNNKFQGKGTFSWQDGRTYQGLWRDNMMHGFGIFKWPNGQIFKGNYECDKKQGKGELILADGTVVNGRWINGKLQGLSEVVKDGLISKVRWKEGVQVNL